MRRVLRLGRYLRNLHCCTCAEELDIHSDTAASMASCRLESKDMIHRDVSGASAIHMFPPTPCNREFRSEQGKRARKGTPVRSASITLVEKHLIKLTHSALWPMLEARS